MSRLLVVSERMPTLLGRGGEVKLETGLSPAEACEGGPRPPCVPNSAELRLNFPTLLCPGRERARLQSEGEESPIAFAQAALQAFRHRERIISRRRDSFRI
ncbi:unnamed protein product [Polarella glacialis]|uniref:Uncharacterized protein n=1 Tax=Polarella glacialis TaxID=89957 RepID=A0A813JRN6_POLGL|nr:unnamed protein product [Polarella glacialis]CAE8687906.1 unnamed protein product [Polarella glacialis]|mmetsp:Transcript_6227/g.11671  ORF Transcript_6227/g.11671 Transcript_6227/m.11671 type:complete len:101 (-) Transcript_6227:70-372(-)